VCTAKDVASYLVRQGAASNAWSLQRLVYYCQAWSLAWDGKPLFADAIEAWWDGPVVRGLPCSCDQPLDPGGNPKALAPNEREIIDAVAATYGLLSSDELVDLSHREPPWREAFVEGANATIAPEAMQRFYSRRGLPRAHFPEGFETTLKILSALEPGEEDGLFVDCEEVDGDAMCRWLEKGEGSPWGYRSFVD
jgi:uncharacterized phage-associated protein